MTTHGRLLASGRDADIFELGPSRVLRRSRRGRSMAVEAEVITYARDRGFPAPAVESVSADGTELVMERVFGPSMVEVIGRRPWAMRRCAAVLADLHRRLHDLAAPTGLAPAPFGAGGTLLHLDLHPLNVLMSAGGPVLIDWSNAAAGAAEGDVALTWVLLASGTIPGGRVKASVLGRGRALFVSSFLSHFDAEPLRQALPGVVEWKLQDPNMSAAECEHMRRLAKTVSSLEGHGAE